MRAQDGGRGKMKATIIKVFKGESIGIRTRYIAEFEDGRTYVFIAGTIGAPKGDAQVGDKGTVEFRTGPSYGWWFWENDAK